uniref:Uncharacterized protein n=1 Tax=Arundo donax TaxID=35708 RepID=A0A0A9EHN3_ARUDO
MGGECHSKCFWTLTRDLCNATNSSCDIDFKILLSWYISLSFSTTANFLQSRTSLKGRS